RRLHDGAAARQQGRRGDSPPRPDPVPATSGGGHTVRRTDIGARSVSEGERLAPRSRFGLRCPPWRSKLFPLRSRLCYKESIPFPLSPWGRSWGSTTANITVVMGRASWTRSTSGDRPASG